MSSGHMDPITELATLLARGYVGLLAARAKIARNLAISPALGPSNLLDVRPAEWPAVQDANDREAREK